MGVPPRRTTLKRAKNFSTNLKEDKGMKTAIFVLGLVLAIGALCLGLASGADVAKGKAAFQQYCASCHGAAGKGDGPMGASMKPKPKDFSDKTYNGSLKEDYLSKVIKEGGQAVGKSPMMPKMGGVLKDGDVADVIAYIRSLGK
jgi:mono/diheme cytochrome c family protein